MEKNIKISVIIPTYNVELYLRECLDSVINQTLKDIEIICINDGSTDNSLKILEEYAQKDSRIIVINQENQGVGAARNNGMKLAQGDYICFLDPDDFYPENDILEALYTNAVNNNANICGGSFAILQDDKIKTQFDGIFYGYVFEKDGFIEYKDWQYDYGYHRFIYKNQLLKDNNIEFPNYRRFQDPPFFVKAMFAAQKFYAITKITYLLREFHKKIKWTKAQKSGLVNGIKDNLDFAQKHNLEKLYYLTCERFNQHAYCFKIKDFFYLHIQDIANSLDLNITSKYNPDFKLSPNLMLQKQILQKFFSLKNTDTHKVLTVLGIKIKFARGKDNV